MACWTSVFFQIEERFNPPAHYGSSSWMGPTAGPMACWTIMFFPIGQRFDPPADYGSSSWTNGLLDKLVLHSKGAVYCSSPLWVRATGPMASWKSLFFPIGSGLEFQPIMGPAAGPMACWTSLFFSIGERFHTPAHMGPTAGPMAKWTSLLFTTGERFSPPAHDGSSSWITGLPGKLVFSK
jgi:hypothetical protein